ncbi:hypothetical protein GJW-30_1_01148 [Variibacter gotjawalensis]|uniref:Uncharacterized protein n=1 Tax=Variibacter gotjawalensis TaxID=1333996 RepID=A0A0S3PRV9_9BRAD|nr:hypothetical protein [Variibacter gotjawalensis]NIK48931.1 hypothetical protein [Variibacter gotjawalensis]RZS50787.1 hypothetical protein EV661_3258 [Variibacter gotjawalensis]BAT58621.1 hypothetical protein GJW-30_1_01148 [Variibacter gotjawalensis]
MLKPFIALLSFAFVWSLVPPADAASRSIEATAYQAKSDVSARKKRVVRRHVRHYPRYRVTEYYAPRPFRYYYGPGYRLYWGSPHSYGPQGLMWPYTDAPYPDVTFGFGSW